MGEANIPIEDQYQTVNVRKTREGNLVTANTVEEIIKKIVPAKSFLYRHQAKNNDRANSYLPMDSGTPKKPKKFFRISSYEYPIFTSKVSSNKSEHFNDRGYYSVKTDNVLCIKKTFKTEDNRNKYKSLNTAEEMNDMVVEEHLYEDLNYNDVGKDEKREPESKPYRVKIQELFQSFKLPFFKKNDEVLQDVKSESEVTEVKEKDSDFYENGDVETACNMYDSVHAPRPVLAKEEISRVVIPVEEYLEPIQLEREYCDVSPHQRERRDDSLLAYIMNIFETRFGTRRETSETDESDDSEPRKQPSSPESEPKVKSNMAARPLPIPVENEPFYMDIDRSEAENMLRGEPDGTFILRPSSQPNHAYTLSVSCAGAVHNVGVRRRADGRLALGFARRAETTFPTIAALLRHHRRRRLLLVAGGGVVGATTLGDAPRYYQSPTSLPVPVPVPGPGPGPGPGPVAL